MGQRDGGNAHALIATEEVKLGIRSFDGFAPFSLACGLDHLAEAAGMSAVEGHPKRRGERDGFGKGNRHANPGDRLDKGPMTANGEHEHGHQADLEQAPVHGLRN